MVLSFFCNQADALPWFEWAKWEREEKQWRFIGFVNSPIGPCTCDNKKFGKSLLIGTTLLENVCPVGCWWILTQRNLHGICWCLPSSLEFQFFFRLRRKLPFRLHLFDSRDNRCIYRETFNYGVHLLWLILSYFAGSPPLFLLLDIISLLWPEIRASKRNK